eukprot:2761247-Rhodomonas_salina.1
MCCCGGGSGSGADARVSIAPQSITWKTEPASDEAEREPTISNGSQPGRADGTLDPGREGLGSWGQSVGRRL